MPFIGLCHSAVAGRCGASAGGEAEGGISSIWRTEGRARAFWPRLPHRPLFFPSLPTTGWLAGWLAGHKHTLQHLSSNVPRCQPSLCPAALPSTSLRSASSWLLISAFAGVDERVIPGGTKPLKPPVTPALAGIWHPTHYKVLGDPFYDMAVVGRPCG